MPLGTTSSQSPYSYVGSDAPGSCPAPVRQELHSNTPRHRTRVTGTSHSSALLSVCNTQQCRQSTLRSQKQCKKNKFPSSELCRAGSAPGFEPDIQPRWRTPCNRSYRQLTCRHTQPCISNINTSREEKAPDLKSSCYFTPGSLGYSHRCGVTLGRASSSSKMKLVSVGLC